MRQRASFAASVFSRQNVLLHPGVVAEAAERADADELPVVRAEMPELDTLRGLAVLLVLGYHGLIYPMYVSDLDPGLTGLSGLMMSVSGLGWVGVPLFFVLSGFLITGILLDSKKKEHYYRRFYVRRALRILPIYFVLLVALKVTGIADWPFIAASGVFLSNFVDLLGIPTQYAVLWSLAVEEHFYLLWPAIVRRSSEKALAVVAAAVVVGEPLLRGMAWRGHSHAATVHTWFYLDGLAMGALIALVLRRPGCTRSRLKGLLAAVAAGVTVLVMATVPMGLLSQTTWVGFALQRTAIHGLFACLLLTFLVIGTGPHRHFVRIPGLMFFGYISYGLYLCHLLVMTAFDRLVAWRFDWQQDDYVADTKGVLIRFAVMVTFSSILAWASRTTFEAWFLRLKTRWAA